MAATLSTTDIWEAAWSEYVDALDSYDAAWSGENFVLDISRMARRLKDAKASLRTLDAEFYNRLGI